VIRPDNYRLIIIRSHTRATQVDIYGQVRSGYFECCKL